MCEPARRGLLLGKCQAGVDRGSRDITVSWAAVVFGRLGGNRAACLSHTELKA